jgi:hypothetical protein
MTFLNKIFTLAKIKATTVINEVGSCMKSPAPILPSFCIFIDHRLTEMVGAVARVPILYPCVADN